MSEAEKTQEARKLVKKAGMTHREVAEALGVHRVTVSRWLNGSIPIPTSRLAHLRLQVWARSGGLGSGAGGGM